MFRQGVALCAVGLLLSGCGGSGGNSAGSGPVAPGPTTTQSATLALRVQQPAALQHLPFDTVSVTVSLLDPNTLQPLVPSQTLQGPGTASFGNVPLGSALAVATAYNGNGIRLTQGSTSFTVQPGTNSVTITSNYLPEYVYTTNTVAQTVSGFQFDPSSGTLAPVPTSVIPSGGLPSTGAFTLTADQNGQFLYVCDVIDHELLVYSIDAGTGGLTALPSLSVALPSDAAFGFPQITPDNNFLYIDTSEPDPLGPTNGTIIRVRGYQRNVQTGTLTATPNSPFDPGTGVAAPHTEVFNGSAVTIDPTGHYLYQLLGAQPSSGPLQVFVAELAINQTDGSLSPISGSPDFVPNVPGEEYSAVFLNAQGTLGITLTFDVSTTGLIQGLGSNGLFVPPPVSFTNSSSLSNAFAAFDPSGQLLLLPDNAPSLDVYTLSGTTVPASPTATLASAPSPGFMVFDPTEQYLLTVCRGLVGNGFNDSGINIFSYTSNPPSLSSLNNFVSVPGRSDMAVFAVPAQPVQQ